MHLINTVLCPIKVVNVTDYPINLEPYHPTHGESGHLLRARTNRIFNDSSRLRVARHSFNIDAAKLWNSAPTEITAAPSPYAAKKVIIKYCKSLPI